MLKNSFVLYSETRTVRKSTQNICVWGLIVNQLTANQELYIHFIRLSQFKLFVIYTYYEMYWTRMDVLRIYELVLVRK